MKLDTCVKFDVHQSNNNKVMMGGPYAPPPPMTDGSKKPMSNRVNNILMDSDHLNSGIKPLLQHCFCFGRFSTYTVSKKYQ